jgi:25S rRNA (uracil2634-N3)-methyltransferase
MGKSKPKERKGHSNHQDDAKNRKRGIVKRDYSQPKAKSSASQHPQPSQKKPKIPFEKYDQALLVGEGDFSFALSLVKTHNVRNVVATCYDSEKELHAKYPHVRETLAQLLGRSGKAGEDEEEEWNGFSSSEDSISDESFDDEGFVSREDLPQSTSQATVQYGINATKLSTRHRKLLLSNGPFSKIVFNFPHVGGLSTDVNRQVRSNQELLVGFFKAAKALLASESNPISVSNTTDEQDDINFDLETGEPISNGVAPTNGQIIVTLFEGEPYTLWNIRDLARHCSLKVVESFKFPWSAYLGYKHTRTIGEISGKETNGKRPGAWRGEEREARMYVLEVKDEEPASQAPAQAGGTGGNQTVFGKRKKKVEINGVESDDSD